MINLSLQGNPGDKNNWDFADYDGMRRAIISAPDIFCSGCIAKIENALKKEQGIEDARVNLSTKRVTVRYNEHLISPEQILNCVRRQGFAAHPYRSPQAAETRDNEIFAGLIRALIVSGLATLTIMSLSMLAKVNIAFLSPELANWGAAIIALPAISYAGLPFFRSAWNALKTMNVNMDVPISLAVLLAFSASLYELMTGGEGKYFDASVMLLFFLLIGRTLDHAMRARARSAVTELVKLTPQNAVRIFEDGTRQTVDVADLDTGMVVAVAAGERVPVDGKIISGKSDLDFSLVTGESEPVVVSPGDKVFAGVINNSGPVSVKITATQDDTLLADIVRLMEAAEQNKAGYVRLASRAAEIYVPLVHGLAATAFVGWLVATGGDWHQSLLIATSVLIITCPCALGLAVPVVQIVASGALFRSGVLVKDGAALEKMAEIDYVLFDKTGTLTKGMPSLVSTQPIDTQRLAFAAGLGQHSTHPLSKAVVKSAVARGIAPAEIENLKEIPGCGIEGTWKGKQVRLGRGSWLGAPQTSYTSSLDSAPTANLEFFLSVNHEKPIRFEFEDVMRSDVKKVVRALLDQSVLSEIVSGDKKSTVKAFASRAGITQYTAEMSPQDKVHYAKHLSAQGRKVLMVGDGLNDAPALSAAHTSMAPATASDIGRMAADFVFTGETLAPILETLRVAKQAHLLVLQNFMLAALYNVIAVPIAMSGHVTPLIAAIAMSTSSLVVTLNALRLNSPQKNSTKPNTTQRSK